jgi:ferredoxin
LCVGAGLCVLSMPDIFDQSEADGQVVLLMTPPAKEAGNVKVVAHLCPSGAITLAED